LQAEERSIFRNHPSIGEQVSERCPADSLGKQQLLGGWERVRR
jgi:hypothetical protein